MSLCVGSEVLIAVIMRSSIFWDVTPRSTLKVNRRFGGTYLLRLQGRRIRQARNQRESRWQDAFTLVTCLVYSLTLKMEAACSSKISFDFQRNTPRFGVQRGSMWPRVCTSCWWMCTIKTRVMSFIPTKSDACTSTLWPRATFLRLSHARAKSDFLTLSNWSQPAKGEHPDRKH
jgi:hypothetical protein